MINTYLDIEYFNIVKDILDNSEFKKLENITHHDSNRFDHVERVSYISYKIAKKLKLDYVSCARSGLLHDFFLEENNNIKLIDRIKLLFNHPTYALNNSMNYFKLNDKEKNIILSHMFPIGKNLPRYIESWLVDIVDDVVAFFEKGYVLKKELSASLLFILIFINNL